MTTFTFHVQRSPFPRWWGPFSPARGVHSGFRFHARRLGTWVGTEFGREFWCMQDSPGARALSQLIRDHWQGGRVLLLPNGLVIKPLQRDLEVGERVLVGRFQGAVVLEEPEGGVFDLSAPGSLAPGALWPGPKSAGLECAIQPDGSLECTWYHPAEWGREMIRMQLHPADRQLASGFRLARPGESGGRVRVTANGFVVTNRQDRGLAWIPIYVGRIAPESWLHHQEWIGEHHTWAH